MTTMLGLGDLPPAVSLTPREQALAAKINFHPDSMTLGENFHDILRESCEAAPRLTKSLIKRNAIPQHRLEYFTDPRYNIGTKLSRQGVFERNGTSGEEIVEHGNFLKYLYYFIFGADLPKPTIEGFCKIVRDDRGTSGEVMSQMHRYARKEIRDRKLDSWHAAEEFYKLALDCGLDVDRAKGVRKAALAAK